MASTSGQFQSTGHHTAPPFMYQPIVEQNCDISNSGLSGYTHQTTSIPPEMSPSAYKIPHPYTNPSFPPPVTPRIPSTLPSAIPLSSAMLSAMPSAVPSAVPSAIPTAMPPVMPPVMPPAVPFLPPPVSPHMPSTVHSAMPSLPLQYPIGQFSNVPQPMISSMNPSPTCFHPCNNLTAPWYESTSYSMLHLPTQYMTSNHNMESYCSPSTVSDPIAFSPSRQTLTSAVPISNQTSIGCESVTASSHTLTTSYSTVHSSSHLSTDSSHPHMSCRMSINHPQSSCRSFQHITGDETPILKFRPKLARLYTHKPVVSQDDWPPVLKMQYINLALISQQKFNFGDEYLHETIRGCVDDIMNKKEEIKYENVFAEVKDGDRILFDGRPGCGKTTTMHKISKDWGEEKLFPSRMLFLVHLRVFSCKSDIKLEDVLQATSKDFSKEEIDTMCNCIVENGGKDIVFVLDGLDEYRPKNKHNNFIQELIRGDRLQSSVVIVASRPAASQKIRKCMTLHIEIIGFLKEEINEYIDCFYDGRAEQAKGLKEYLEQHPNVFHMCYLPIHLAMITFLYQKMGTNLPQTETEIYHRFTLYTLMRFLCKQRDSENSGEVLVLKDFDDLKCHNLNIIFEQILQFGFIATVNSKQVFCRSDREVEVLFSSDHYTSSSEASDSKLGLLVVDRDNTLNGLDEIYTFLHLTFQEYLAACHVARLHPSEQLEIITQHAKKKHLAVVFKFYCGMTHKKFTQNDVMENFKVLMRENTSNSLLRIHCAHESQQECTCTYIIESNNAAVRVNKQSLNAADCTALGYVLKKSAVPAKVMELTSCTFFPESFTAFMKGCGDDSLSSVESLRLLRSILFIYSYLILFNFV